MESVVPNRVDSLDVNGLSCFPRCRTLALILYTVIFTGELTFDTTDIFCEFGHPPPAPPFKGGETVRRRCPTKERTRFDGAVLPRSGHASTTLSYQGADTLRRRCPTKERRRFDSAIQQRREIVRRRYPPRRDSRAGNADLLQ